MNLTEAHKIATAATDALDAAIGSAQLLLARKRQEREARLLRFDDIVTVMEAEKDTADAEIEALEVLIFGEKKTDEEKLAAITNAAVADAKSRLPNGHADAAE